jgi:hypothetical protein
MHAASDEAIVIAGSIGDPGLVVRAAAVATYDALWPARRYGESNEAVIQVMRETLAGLSLDDSALRCRLLVALATESYYVARTSELDRLVEEALGIARRIGEPALLAETLLGCVVVLWRADQVDRRQSLLEECRQLAEQVGDERLTVNARCLQASVRCELGLLSGPDPELAEIAMAARELRMYFPELIVVCLAHSWSAMRGDQAELAAQWTRIAELDDLMSMAHKVDTIQGAAFYVPMWNFGQLPRDEHVQGFLGVTAVPVVTAAVALFLRHGAPERARTLWDGHTFDPDTDNWYSPAYWAFSAEAALGFGDPAVGAAVYTRLRPYSGQCVMSGSNPAIGPVDAYLAIAAAATGDLALATEHADRAIGQIRTWQVPQVESWFLGLRDKHGF